MFLLIHKNDGGDKDMKAVEYRRIMCDFRKKIENCNMQGLEKEAEGVLEEIIKLRTRDVEEYLGMLKKNYTAERVGRKKYIKGLLLLKGQLNNDANLVKYKKRLKKYDNAELNQEMARIDQMTIKEARKGLKTLFKKYEKDKKEDINEYREWLIELKDEYIINDVEPDLMMKWEIFQEFMKEE